MTQNSGPNGQRPASLERRHELLKPPVIHADLTAAAALAAAHKHRAAPRIETELGQIQRLLDPQPGAPEHRDQSV